MPPRLSVPVAPPRRLFAAPLLFSAPLLLAAQVLFAALLLLAPSTASAYCRTHTCEFDGTDVCQTDETTGCSSGGELAHWKSGCISYAVQGNGSSATGISAEVLEGLLEDGFRVWSDVECGGSTTPELSSFFRGETSCDQVEYNCGARGDNANIAMFRDGDSDLSAFTIALSTIIANLKTGEILDVDIEINSRDFDFYADDADARDESHDLRLVINHELGHFLGLSHSVVPGALMRSEYEGSSLLPAADDIAGMCDIFPTGTGDPSCSASTVLDDCLGADSRCPVPVQPKSRGCSIETSEMPTASSPAWLLGSACGLLALGQARRRARALRAVTSNAVTSNAVTSNAVTSNAVGRPWQR